MLAAIRKKINEDGEYHFGRWGSFWHRFALTPWDWRVRLCKFRDHWSLHLFCLWITLGQHDDELPGNEIMLSWGVFYDSECRAVHLSWGARDEHRSRYKILHLPWSYHHCVTEIMLVGQRFVAWERFQNLGKNAKQIIENPEPSNRYRITLPYRYVLRSGEVQNVDATVTVERRSWCWRAWPFSWLRWPSKTSTTIAVEFSAEVGEGTGSWKGGTVGCGYTLLPGESPERCLRRMEAERKFER